MKTCLDLLWNVLANADPGDADWANHLPVDTNDYRNGDHILTMTSLRVIWHHLVRPCWGPDGWNLFWWWRLQQGLGPGMSVQSTRQVKQQKWETKWHHSAQNLQKQMNEWMNEWMWLNNTSHRIAGGLLWTWEWTAHRHTEGVAFMVRKSAAKALIGWVPMSPKITVSSLHDSTPRTERSPSLHITATCMLQPIHLHFINY